MFKRNTMQLHCIPQLVNGLCKCKTLRLRLIRLQTNSGNQFPENGAFGCDGKRYFPEIEFLLTKIWSLDHGNEFLSWFSLQFISVACKTQREGEKKQETQHASERERTNRDRTSHPELRSGERARESRFKRTPNRDRTSHPELRSGERARESRFKRTPNRDRSSNPELRFGERPPRQTPQTHGEWQLKLTPIRHTLTSPPTHTSDPLTSPVHTSDPPHRSLFFFFLRKPDPISEIYIYIYIYLFIYLFSCLFI